MAAQPTVRNGRKVEKVEEPTRVLALRPEGSAAARHATTHPVVVGVDGSPRNEAAVLWAAEEAASLGQPLVLVTVTGADDEDEGTLGGDALRAAARATLERASRLVARSYPGLTVRTQVRSGSPRRVLAGDATGLLVVGRRGSGGFARLPLGSTSLWVAGTADNGVAVIPDRPGPRPADGFGPEATTGGLLVALDAFSPEPGVLEFAFERAQQRALPVRVVSAWEVPPVMAHSRAGIRQAWQRQEEQVSRAQWHALLPWLQSYPDVGVEREVVHGHPAGVVLELQSGEELTVLGRGGHRGDGFRMGPITRSVLHLSTGPVAVVP
jgi:nucleotide-binding universal stress UspA family protein